MTAYQTKLFLQIDKSGDFIFTRKSNDYTYNPSAKFPWPNASKLDFTMCTDTTVTIEIGNSMANWEFCNGPSRTTGRPSAKPIYWKKGVGRGRGHRPDEVEVDYVSTSPNNRSIVFECVACDNYKSGSGNQGMFKYDLYLINKSGGEGVIVTIDPTGGGETPPFTP